MNRNNPAPDAEHRDPTRVREMFDRIAGRYDIANHVLSFGMDFAWRRRVAEIVATWQPELLLDLATGTGDLALAIQQRIPHCIITGCDASTRMLEIARKKGLSNTVVADAAGLPFADGSYDAITIAFGLRNMLDRAAVIRECARLLRIGGHLLILDFSLPGGPLRKPYRYYLHHILPRIAGLIAGDRTAYEYLAESIEQFPSGAAMCEFLTANGLYASTAEQRTAGIVTIYTATKP